MSVLALVVALGPSCQQIDSETQRLDADNGSEVQLFGASVAVTRHTEAGGGYTLAVGAPGDDSASTDGGAVYVYENGTLAAALPGALPSAGDQRGEVALHENTLVVASWGADDPGGAVDAGRVQIYWRDSANTWSLKQTLEGSSFNASPQDGFGALEVHDLTIVVGAKQADEPGMTDAGVVYVIEPEASMLDPDDPWAGTLELTKLVPQTTPVTSGDWFGSVSVWGDRIAVGGRRRNVTACNGNVASMSCDEGAVWMFERSGTTWVEQDFVTAEAGTPPTSDVQTADEFGFSVALYDDTLVVGAPGNDQWCDMTTSTQEVNCDSGAAYVYRLIGTAWELEQKLTAQETVQPSATINEARPFERFGYSVAAHGRRIVVGAPGRFAEFGSGAMDGSTTPNGGAYVFEDDGDGTWFLVRVLTEEDFMLTEPSPNAFFGSSVDAESNLIAVGAPLDSSPGSLLAGRAYTYYQAYESTVTILVSSCFGDGGDQMGCTDCPCGNNSPPGSIGGCQNSSGSADGAVLIAAGHASVSNPTLRFEGYGLVSSSLAILQAGVSLLPINPPCPPGSGIAPANFDGLRCVGGGAIRVGSRSATADGTVGVVNRGWGLPDGPPDGLLPCSLSIDCNPTGPIVGSTRHYQIFYREDLMLGCMTGQNTSNAVSVTFTN